MRAISGTSGLASLKIEVPRWLEFWMELNGGVNEFIASEYLPGRNLACKMLYLDGSLVRSATGERVEYIMAKVAPSGVTGNTAFGRLIDCPRAVDVADRAIRHVCDQLGEVPHGFFTADLKEDANGVPKLTEVNVRHVAFTSTFAAAGANLAEDMLNAALRRLDSSPHHYTFERDYVFFRDVDALPMILEESKLYQMP